MIGSIAENMMKQFQDAFPGDLEDSGEKTLKQMDRLHSIGWWYFQKILAKQGITTEEGMKEFMPSIACCGAHLANFAWSFHEAADGADPSEPDIITIHNMMHDPTTAMSTTATFIFFGVLIEGGYLVGLDFQFTEKEFQAWHNQVIETNDGTVPSLFGPDDPPEADQETRSQLLLSPPMDLPDVPSGDVPRGTESDGDGEEDEIAANGM